MFNPIELEGKNKQKKPMINTEKSEIILSSDKRICPSCQCLRNPKEGVMVKGGKGKAARTYWRCNLCIEKIRTRNKGH